MIIPSKVLFRSLALICMVIPPLAGHAQERVRARDLGVAPGIFAPGKLNAITDVAGVRVGQATLREGDKVRTGVTAILPHGGNAYRSRVPAALHVGNGYGKFAGSTQVDELGELETPILLTCTLCVWKAADAMAAWMLEQPDMQQVRSINPVVGETNDGDLNDIRARPITADSVRQALESAGTGPVAEGSVGAGNGTIAFGWKGGIGTSSRVLPASLGGWTVGVLVQANHGKRQELRVDGYPVGRRLMDIPSPFAERGTPGMGSIVVILATDAPLLPHQCQRLAQRASIGIARTGGGTEDSSGDLFLAFATGNQDLPAADYGRKGLPFSSALQMVNNDHISPLFSAAAEAVEEAIINAILAGETMNTDDGVQVPGLMGETLLQALHDTGWSVSR